MAPARPAGMAATEPYHPPAGPLRLHHVDAAMVIADKPPGLLSVPGRGPEKADCTEARVAALCPGARHVHRLDMETSGLIVFARTAAAHRALSAAFAARGVAKRYVALVSGSVAGEAGRVEAPLMTDWPNRPRQRVDTEAGKPACTDWQVLARGPGWTRLSLIPVTGRSHQLRVHLAHIGHPILGDRLYGDPGAAPRLMLHAERLALAHPDSGVTITVEAPAPF